MYAQVHDTLQRVLQMYIFHLIDTGGRLAWPAASTRCPWLDAPVQQGSHTLHGWPGRRPAAQPGGPLAAPHAGAHALVPRYACHLRAGLRHTTYQIFFEQLLAQVRGAGRPGRWTRARSAQGPCASAASVDGSSMRGQRMLPLLSERVHAWCLSTTVWLLLPPQGPMEECRAAYGEASQWFAFWRSRGGGDVAEEEAAIIADKVWWGWEVKPLAWRACPPRSTHWPEGVRPLTLLPA